MFSSDYVRLCCVRRWAVIMFVFKIRKSFHVRAEQGHQAIVHVHLALVDPPSYKGDAILLLRAMLSWVNGLPGCVRPKALPSMDGTNIGQTSMGEKRAIWYLTVSRYLGAA